MNNSEYQLAKYHRRRALALEILGGVCVQCGTNEDLELDHIDPNTKSFNIGTAWTRTIESYLDELKKCQLLCSACHQKKTTIHVEVPHGGGKCGKRGCKCGPCKAKKAEYMKEYGQSYKRTPRDRRKKK